MIKFKKVFSITMCVILIMTISLIGLSTKKVVALTKTVITSINKSTQMINIPTTFTIKGTGLDITTKVLIADSYLGCYNPATIISKCPSEIVIKVEGIKNLGYTTLSLIDENGKNLAYTGFYTISGVKISSINFEALIKGVNPVLKSNETRVLITGTNFLYGQDWRIMTLDYEWINSPQIIGGDSNCVLMNMPVLENGNYILAYYNSAGREINEIKISIKDFEPKFTDLTNKSWTITFNKAINPASVNNQNVYVTSDENGQNIIPNVEVKLAEDAKQIIVNYDNKELWEMSKTYYLFLTKDILAVDRGALVDRIKMKFTIQK